MSPLQIGVLYSTTGVTAAVETTQQRGVIQAAEEINEAGGVLGREIELVCVNPASSPRQCARLSEQLVVDQGIRLLMGCYMSSTRKAVIPVIERHNALLFYATAYEGFEFNRNVFYGGAAPNQNILPLADYMLSRFGSRVAMVGSDYVCPYEANRVMSDLIYERGGHKAMETYLPLDAGLEDYRAVARAIKSTGVDFIYSTLVGPGNAQFHRALEEAGVDRLRTPLSSHMSCEADVALIGADLAEGLITCASYFESIDSATNQRAIRRYRSRFGETEHTNVCWEAAYFQTHLLAAAIRASGSADPVHVARALPGLGFEAPQGFVQVDRHNNHTHLNPRIGRCNASGAFDILAQSPAPVPADPYVVSHSPAPWSHRATPQTEGQANSSGMRAP